MGGCRCLKCQGTLSCPKGTPGKTFVKAKVQCRNMELELEQYEILDAEGRVRLGPLELRLEAGLRCLVLGPTGAGKTLFLRGFAGNLPPGWKFQGVCRHGGRSLASSASPALAWMPQDPLEGLNPWLRVREHLELLPSAWRIPEASERVPGLVRHLGLGGLEGRFPRELSGGQRQRLLLVMLLSCAPQWLLLDEPTAALDAQGAADFCALLEALRGEFGFGWIWVSHTPELALRHADHLLVMDQGRCVAQGTPAELLAEGATGLGRRLLEAARFS